MCRDSANHKRFDCSLCVSSPNVHLRLITVYASSTYGVMSPVHHRPLPQIAAIITSPDFPGWLAPLDFSPTRFSEFVALTVTLVGTWVAAGLMVGAYRTAATSDLPAALRVASLTWLSAMPVAAAQLVIVTAVESR